MINASEMQSLLYKYFQIESFRPGQREIIEDVLAGKDVLGVLPTGTGKSLCYQLPAQILTGQTIVVSPLISLMVDQVKQLKAKGFKRAVAINSFMSYEERKKVYQNLRKYRLIYVSPEILQQPTLLNYLKRLKISLFVIDEAHCISQWGHEFRPDYLRLQDIIQQLNKPPILALSATVSLQVKKDIIHFLKLPEIVEHIYPVDRKNIILTTKEIAHDQEKNEFLLNFLKERPVPTLIYFSSRLKTEQIANFLQEELKSLNITYYHGGMEAMDRLQVQQQFMNNQLDIICCTSAFGMGIDKEDIRQVIHYHIPSQIESFIQEIGRAGRDGKQSLSLVLYHQNDLSLPRRLIETELPTEKTILSVLKQLKKLYEENRSLPSLESEIEGIFACDISQWRFLFYQLEKSGIIKGNQIVYNPLHWKQVHEEILKIRMDRLQFKHHQLNEMFQWLYSEDCLRRKLYENFQRGYELLEDQCCHNCGYSLEEWSPKPLNEKEKLKDSWQELLNKIFFEEGLYE